MCLFITLFAAILATLAWYFINSNCKLGTLSLIYWGAGIMWIVDCSFAYFSQEPFWDISVDDALLGGVVVWCGLVLWFLLLVYKNPQKLLAKILN
ncbi:MAG: hypothetical protein J1E31_08195 [Helicobacter sp.]|nr:hypothetical protein [Helicobacter sp.]